jgi:hypothetical protein
LHHIYEKLRLAGRTQLALVMAQACAPIPLSGNDARPLGQPACQHQPKNVAQRSPGLPVVQARRQRNRAGLAAPVRCP